MRSADQEYLIIQNCSEDQKIMSNHKSWSLQRTYLSQIQWSILASGRREIRDVVINVPFVTRIKTGHMVLHRGGMGRGSLGV